MRANPLLLAVVDPRRCEAKTACVAVCPTEAIAIEPLPRDVCAELPWVYRLKAWVHGNRWAAIDTARCLGCAACVPVCPEHAIRLAARSEPPSDPQGS